MHTYGQGRWVAWTYCGVAIGINYDVTGLGQYGVDSRRLYSMSSLKWPTQVSGLSQCSEDDLKMPDGAVVI